MSEIRPSDNRFGEPSLEDIHRSDSFIEALAAGRQATAQDPGDAELAALLGGWRDETRWPSDAGLITESQAIAALNAGLAEKPRRGTRERRDVPPATRHRRGLSVVGAAAAAALCLGGFGAVVSGSEPGDSLYGLRTMLFGTPKQVRDEKVGLAARTELLKVQELITQGDWEQAQEKLVAVSTQVATLGDEQQKQELLTQFNDLSAKVVERDPAATAPPGIVYTVPPSAAELVPAVAPAETSTPTTSTTTTSTTTTSGETTGTTSTTTSGAPTSETSTSTTTTSPTATTSAPSTATSTAAPATTSSSSSVPASAPVSSAAPASTAAPAQTSSPAPAAATSVPSSPATSATSAEVGATSATPAATQPSTESVTQPSSTAAATAEPAGTAAPAVTTTAAVPAPVG